MALGETLSPSETVDLARDATRMIHAVPHEDGLRDSPRSSLLRKLLASPGDPVRAPDLPGIRYVLDALHAGKGWNLKVAGWTGGPFLMPKTGK